MTLDQIIAIANAAYPDGCVADCYDPKNGRSLDCGDTLALFIVRELTDTYDATTSDLEQLVEAHRVIFRAELELGDVNSALLEAMREVRAHDEHIIEGVGADAK